MNISSGMVYRYKEVILMGILKLIECVLTRALESSYEDYLDLRLTTAQARELRDTIHRIITYDDNMKKEEKL